MRRMQHAIIGAFMRFTAWLVLIATLLLWSGNWLVARAVRDEISPGLATVGRLVVVLAILLPFAWRALRQKLPQLAPRDWLVLGALGLTGGGPPLRLQWVRPHFTPPADRIPYPLANPVFIPPIDLPLGRERLLARPWIRRRDFVFGGAGNA